MPNTPHRFIAFLLAALVALGPFAIDTYLPAIPAMAEFYQASSQQTAISLSVFLLGFACGQLIGGPLSDRIGRRPVALTGLSTFILSTTAILPSTELWQLWTLRYFQALGGGFATVIAGAVVRDLYQGHESARLFSRIATIMLAAPLLAPGVGSLILKLFSWQAIFAFLLIYACAVLLLIAKALPETRQTATATPGGIKQVLHDYLNVLSHRQGLAYIFTLAFAFSCMFVFITESAYIYLEHFQLENSLFPVLFGSNIVLMILCNRLNLKLLKNHSPQQILRWGSSLQLGASSLLALLALNQLVPLWVVFPGIVIAVGSLGLIAPNATASCLQFFPNSSGTANAMMGTIQFIMGGLVGALISSLPHEGGLITPLTGMAACAALSLLFSRIATRQRQTLA